MEWARFAFEVGMTLSRAIFDAVTKGDSSILDKPVRELLGGELATTLAKKAADAKAREKFGEA